MDMFKLRDLYSVSPVLLIFFFISSLLLLPATGLAGKQQSDPAPKSDQVTASQEHRDKNTDVITDETLSPGDIIKIRFDPRDRQKDLDGIYQVDTDGNVIMPGAGSLHVAGIRLDDMNREFKERVGKRITINFLPEVKLVKQVRFVQIINGVRYPGWYQVAKDIPLEQFARQAGGLNPDAKLDNATITRNAKVLSYEAALPLHSFDMLAFGDSDNAITTSKVDSGDLLYVIIPKEVSAENLPTEKSYFKEQVEVDRYGYIFLPSQGNVYVQGMLPKQISELLTKNLPKYLSKNDSAVVNLVEKRNFVQILGQVQNPGWHNIPETANLQSAVNSAGGLLDGANMSKITIIRFVDRKKIVLPADLFHYITTGDERMLPVIHENDTIFVPLSSSFGVIKRRLGSWTPPDSRLNDDDASYKIRIFGGVRHPGIYEPQKDMSLLDLIIVAGGSTDDADLSNCLIIRDKTPLRYNIKQLIEQSAPIPSVQAGDVVQIGRFEKSGFKRKTSKEMIRIFGAIRNPGGYIHTKNMTILDLIIAAGGSREDADLSNVLLIRKGKTLKYNLKQLIEQSGKLPLVQLGDIVQVGRLKKSGYKSKASKDKARIFGAVKKSGGYTVTKDMTVLDLLTKAGGEVPGADLSSVIILRKNGTIEKFNMKAVFENPNASGADFPKINIGDTVKIGFLLSDTYREKATKDKVRIFGAVAKPGSYEYTPNMNLLDLIIAANGETEQADLSNIKIIRANGKTESCNLDQLIEKSSPPPKVYSGDIIQIGRLQNKPKTTGKMVRIFGAVRNTGGYTHTQGMTILDLIIAAGGGTDDADLSNILLIRKKKTHKYNLKQIIEQSSTVPLVEPGDVVQVGRMEKSGYKSKTSRDKARIFGAVQKSGAYVVTKGMTLLDLLTKAGGEVPSADLSSVIILRKNGMIDKVNMKAIFEDPDASGYSFPLIHAGDTVKINFLLSDTYREKATKDKVRIFGAVAKPGSYEYTPNMTLLDLIIGANGETAQADLSNIQILRANGKTELYNLKQALNSDEERQVEFPPVFSGDIVHIGFLVQLHIKSKSNNKKIRIFGAVHRPDGYEVKKDMTLVDLITEAGGETLYADLSKIMIYRPDGSNEEFDLKWFLDGGGQGGSLPVFTGGEVVYIPHRPQDGNGQGQSVSAQHVTVSGPGCRSNGVYPFKPPMTVLEAIALAGGLDDFADTDNIMIIRRVHGKQENIPYNYDSGVRGLVPEVNLLLQSGDIVYVP